MGKAKKMTSVNAVSPTETFVKEDETQMNSSELNSSQIPNPEEHDMSTITIKNATDKEVKDVVETLTHKNVGTLQVKDGTVVVSATTPKKRGPKPGQTIMSSPDFFKKYNELVKEGCKSREEAADKLGISVNLLIQKRQMINAALKEEFKGGKMKTEVQLPLLPGEGQHNRGRSKIDWSAVVGESSLTGVSV